LRFLDYGLAGCHTVIIQVGSGAFEEQLSVFISS